VVSPFVSDSIDMTAVIAEITALPLTSPVVFSSSPCVMEIDTSTAPRVIR
jgi:hypothetical protein